MTPPRDGSAPLRDAPSRAAQQFNGSAEVHTLAAHGMFSPQQAAAVRDLVSRLYQALARASDADDWAELRALIGDLKVAVADAAPLISFDTGDLRGNVEAYATRVLFNNLHEFLSENASIIVGHATSPRAFASASRFDCPLLAPYLGKSSLIYASSNELVDEIIFEIAQSTKDHRDRS